MKYWSNFKNIPAWIHWLIFVFMLIGAFFYFNFQQIMFLGPQSVHFWRQIDCLSFTLNYMMEDRSLFNPAVNYIGVGGNGEMISDFPLLFYIIGKIWRITGQQEWIFRLVVYLIFSGAVLSIFSIVKNKLNDLFWALVLPILLFTSPVITYYSSSFVMNITAFSFALMGLSSFYWFYHTKNTKWLWLSSIVYLVGGLIKIPALMTFVVILFVYLTEVINLIRYKQNNERIFFQKAKHALPFVLVIAGVALWVLFMTNYNKNNGGMFLTGIFPIWDLTREQIKTIVVGFIDFWYRQHFHLSMHVLTLIVFGWLIIKFRKLSRIEQVFLFLMPLGVTMFILLWFKAMPFHDYYLTNSYALFIIVWIMAIKLLVKQYPRFGKSIVLKLVFVIFVGFNFSYCKKEIKLRYFDWWNVNYHIMYEPLIDLKPILRDAGLTRNDTIIAMADEIPNATLYLLDMKGWSNYGGSHNNLDSAKIAQSIAFGAKYMVLIDTTWQNKDFIKPFTKNLFMEHKSIKIFQLKD